MIFSLIHPGQSLNHSLYHGRPQTFFQGRAEFSRGGGKHIICPKKILFSSKKFKKHTILVCQGGKGPLLPSPADAHALYIVNITASRTFLCLTYSLQNDCMRATYYFNDESFNCEAHIQKHVLK